MLFYGCSTWNQEVLPQRWSISGFRLLPWTAISVKISETCNGAVFRSLLNASVLGCFLNDVILDLWWPHFSPIKPYFMWWSLISWLNTPHYLQIQHLPCTNLLKRHYEYLIESYSNYILFCWTKIVSWIEICSWKE